MLKLFYRLFKYVLVTAIGVAAMAKFVLQSHADPETEEVDLISIFEGSSLVSTADPFYGGKVLAMFSGTALDLRKVTPSPTGVTIDLAAMFAGVALVLPEGWRVRSELKTILGGFADETQTTADPDVPTVTLTGLVVLGGVRVISKPTVEMVS